MASEATLAQIDAMITALGYGTPEYHEAVAMYAMTIARSQWRLADMARNRQEKQAVLERAKVVAGTDG